MAIVVQLRQIVDDMDDRGWVAVDAFLEFAVRQNWVGGKKLKHRVKVLSRAELFDALAYGSHDARRNGVIDSAEVWVDRFDGRMTTWLRSTSINCTFPDGRAPSGPPYRISDERSNRMMRALIPQDARERGLPGVGDKLGDSRRFPSSDRTCRVLVPVVDGLNCKWLAVKKRWGRYGLPRVPRNNFLIMGQRREGLGTKGICKGMREVALSAIRAPGSMLAELCGLQFDHAVEVLAIVEGNESCYIVDLYWRAQRPGWALESRACLVMRGSIECRACLLTF